MSKWTVELDIKNVDDDLTEDEVSFMIAACFDIAWLGYDNPPQVSNIEVKNVPNS